MASLDIDRNGNADSAYRFDGADDILIGDRGFPAKNADRTISAWVKINSNSTGDQTILSYGNLDKSRGLWLGVDVNGSLIATTGTDNETPEARSLKYSAYDDYYAALESYQSNWGIALTSIASVMTHPEQ